MFEHLRPDRNISVDKMILQSPGATLLVLTVLAISPVALSITPSADELVDCLRSSLSPQGVIVLPDNAAAFTNDTLRYSSIGSPSFRIVSQVFNEQDVRAAVCVRSNFFCGADTDSTNPRSTAPRALAPSFWSLDQGMASSPALTSSKMR